MGAINPQPIIFFFAVNDPSYHKLRIYTSGNRNTTEPRVLPYNKDWMSSLSFATTFVIRQLQLNRQTPTNIITYKHNTTMICAAKIVKRKRESANYQRMQLFIDLYFKVLKEKYVKRTGRWNRKEILQTMEKILSYSTRMAKTPDVSK